jgi:hypothetical protein
MEATRKQSRHWQIGKTFQAAQEIHTRSFKTFSLAAGWTCSKIITPQPSTISPFFFLSFS